MKASDLFIKALENEGGEYIWASERRKSGFFLNLSENKEHGERVALQLEAGSSSVNKLVLMEENFPVMVFENL